MANPTGKNSPESFRGFAPNAAYGSKKKAAALTKSAPLAGQGASAHAIGTPHRATELAISQAVKNKQALAPAPAAVPVAAQAPVVPPAVQVVQPDVTAQTWQAVAADPRASDLVRAYAASAT